MCYYVPGTINLGCKPQDDDHLQEAAYANRSGDRRIKDGRAYLHCGSYQQAQWLFFYAQMFTSSFTTTKCADIETAVAQKSNKNFISLAYGNR